MRLLLALPLALPSLASPAAAEVVKASDAGFVVEHRLTIAAPPARVSALIPRPALWWSKDHSYSGDSANITIDPRPGGCWCETLPGGGAIEHMRTLYVDPGKLWRFQGALGPLQSGAVQATLTYALKPVGQGTELTVTYVAGGYLPAGFPTMAPVVDQVLSAQWAGLKRVAEAG
jgi:uncharacterized protein YndB with AHSA1/START domain